MVYRYLIGAGVSLVLHAAYWMYTPSSEPMALTMDEAAAMNTLFALMAAPAAIIETAPAEPEPVIEPKPVVPPKPEPKAKPVVPPKPESVVKPKPVVPPEPAPTPVDTPSVVEPKVHEPVAKKAQNESFSSVASSPPLVQQPTFKVNPTTPDYPRSARRQNQEGTVVIEVWLDEQGRQNKRVIVQSSGVAALDKAALAAVTKWQFNGNQINGRASVSRVRVPVTFKLK